MIPRLLRLFAIAALAALCLVGGAGTARAAESDSFADSFFTHSIEDMSSAQHLPAEVFTEKSAKKIQGALGRETPAKKIEAAADWLKLGLKLDGAAILHAQGRDNAATKQAVKAVWDFVAGKVITTENLFRVCTVLTEGVGAPVCLALSLLARPLIETAVDKLGDVVAGAIADKMYPPDQEGGSMAGGVHVGGVKINANAGSITSNANNGGVAETRIGSVKGGSQVDINASVGGNVITSAQGGVGRTEIGTADGSANINVRVGGEVITTANGGGSTTLIGTATNDNTVPATGSVSISGSVINKGGQLEIGNSGLCKAYRNHQCCVEIHRNLCVLNFFARPPNYPCPPLYSDEGGICYLYSDYKAIIRE